MKKLEEQNKKREAFSLMELMIVIIILGLLAALVMPNIIGKGEQAKQKIVCIQMKNIAQSLEFFKQDNGTYPETEEGLSALIKNPDEEKYSSFAPDGYLSTKLEPKDPWKHKFEYAQTEDSFDILSFGADGKSGTKDDIKLSTCKK